MYRAIKKSSFLVWDHKISEVLSLVISIGILSISNCNGNENYQSVLSDRTENEIENRFPDGFIFGVGTSSYQSEGAWNISNKGESIWDSLTHEKPYVVAGQTNADVAANSYYMYKTDVDLVTQLGANAYRISISWPRILPTGFDNEINNDGIQHYNDVIDEILSKNLTPFVTIYHWDLPTRLQELGGLANPLFVNWFVDYANVLFTAFGDKVKYWTTFNEPGFNCVVGYQGIYAPLINQSGIGEYLCGHHTLLAHAKTYKMYNEKFRGKQQGKIMIALALTWPVLKNIEDANELEVGEQYINFQNGWFLHPLFSTDGDYSKTIKDKIGSHSSIQGFSRSRLPQFTSEEIELIKNSADLLSVNFYHGLEVKKFTDYDITTTISHDADVGVITQSPASAYETGNDTCNIERCHPWALSAIINRITTDYNIPAIMIGENGYRDEGQLDDTNRGQFFYYHLKEVLKLIKEGVNIQGYFAWTLFDIFEWTQGYTHRYGIFSVNITDPQRPRTPKLWSAKVISQIYKTKSIPKSFSSFEKI
ncbi:myrosinase 1-like [Microplitis mediator]|uniref:myrosinase 1-like n=1 Tax=Microplitis mediator TaxID=375433 RepID=UPI002557A1AD|nr:myrosinase 1-like [Microplitis mediator]